jgi:hypothetical protein
MSTTSRPVSATPEQVWSVLADGWLYPLFVVGAARMEEHRRLLLLARGWPAGQAHVEISLRPSGTDTVVTIVEQATSGPGALIPKPVQDVQLHARNIETLRRLAFVVEGRAR